VTTDYNPIAEQYQRSKQQPWRTFIECFTLMDLIGDPTGLSALDLACGEGFYTRLIRHRGAARVHGLDLSDGMIALAQAQEARQPLGVTYAVADARELSGEDPVDLTVAAYLLNYARTREELQAMCDGIARSLKPGGRFVTVNTNPALDLTTAPSYRKYGFETTAVGQWQEGTPIVWTFHLEDGPFSIENYHLGVAAHEEAFERAGFSEVRWHSPALSPEALKDYDSDYWSTFRDVPPVAFIECIR
jgi:ubiquinone/menaquinone biosynthesis C-methylase UbiE